MTETKSARQTWWVAIKNADGSEDEPEVAQVWFNGTAVDEVLRLGREWGFSPSEVRLIERVLPAGRAAAAVEKLEGILTCCWHLDQATDDVREAVDLLQVAPAA